MAIYYITISAWYKPKCPSEEQSKKNMDTYVIKNYAEVINVWLWNNTEQA